MKNVNKLLAILLIFAILTAYASPVGAAPENDEFLYFKDGSYMIVTLHVTEARSGSTKTAAKTSTYYNSLNVAQWSATLTATFEYDGTEYWTIDCGIDVEIINSNWYEISKSATMSGCGATGNVTMGFKWLGITTNKESVTITLSCSPYGVIS